MLTVKAEKYEMMETLDIRELLGYTIETFDMSEFKIYWDNYYDKFSDFSRNAFLKALSIPPAYFMEQPQETREELLNNKLELIKSGLIKKYVDKSIIVISKDGSILNAGNIKTSEIAVRFEAIQAVESVKNIVWSRSLIRDGYLCGYLVCDTVSREEYNGAIFIDLPLLFTKPSVLHKGYIKLANDKMIVEKDMAYYVEDIEVDYAEYKNIASAISDVATEYVADESIDKIAEFNRPINDNPTVDDISSYVVGLACEMIEAGIIPKNMMLSITSHLANHVETEGVLSLKQVVEDVLSFDENTKSIKNVNSLRKCVLFVQKEIEAEKKKMGNK